MESKWANVPVSDWGSNFSIHQMQENDSYWHKRRLTHILERTKAVEFQRCHFWQESIWPHLNDGWTRVQNWENTSERLRRPIMYSTKCWKAFISEVQLEGNCLDNFITPVLEGFAALNSKELLLYRCLQRYIFLVFNCINANCLGSHHKTHLSVYITT